jgi:hypothetical protein
VTPRAALLLAVAGGALLGAGPAAAQEPAPAPDEAALLTLVSPNAAAGQTLDTRRPQFVWRSAPVTEPPGPWRYDLSVFNVAGGDVRGVRNLADTAYRIPFDLETNTSYRWAVTARLTTGDSVRVESRTTFVIVDPTAPLATLLYQNFPNPFPTAESITTCIWFDLATPSQVRLDLYDVRGNHVRSIVPNGEVQGFLQAGRYGRASPAGNSGCDPRFSWDGRAGDGNYAPAGVYLLRLRAAGGVNDFRKVLFRGR